MFGVGVVGLGAMGRRFASGLAAHPDFRVVGAYDPGVREAPFPLMERLDALLSNPAIACIYIASPPLTHPDLVAAAAEAKKAIFCEKPLTVSPASARSCVATVEGARVAAAVNFPFATAPASVRLKALVDEGALGDELTARLRVRFRSWPREWQGGAAGWLAGPEQGGFTREVISHFVFLALRLFGPGRVREHAVERSSNGVETRLRATLECGRTLVTIDGAVEGRIEDENRFEVSGARGSAAITEWYRLEYAEGGVEPSRPDAGQVSELAKLLSGQPHRLATFAEAATVVDLVESMLA